MLLESMEHPASCFITLTYNEECLPLGEIVRKRDVQLFIKNVRAAVAPREVRYYVCSEYGEENGRPHYHGILFGVSPMELGLIQRCWNKGHCMVGTAEHKSMRYVSGYIVKQGTQEGHLLRGTRLTEFALMSRKPGLGAGYIERVRKAYETDQGKAALRAVGTVPSVIRTGGSKYRIGRYLHGRTLEVVGISRVQQSQGLQAVVEAKMEQRRGKTITEISVEYKARVDQQPTTPYRRRTL